MRKGAIYLFLALSAGPVWAQTSLTFDDLPSSYFFANGGQNIGSYYPGVTFGPNVTALSVSRFGGYNNVAFPPQSGDVVIWDATDATITIAFAAPIQSFSIWYTAVDEITLTAYDQNNVVLGAVTGTPNTDGVSGSSSMIAYSGGAIQSVSLTSTAGLFTLSALTYTPASSSPPTTTSVTSVITTVAGDGPGYSGDGGPATSAQLNTPVAVAVDAAGNIYIADSANNRIRKVSPGGIISTVAGNGIQGFAGDGGLATSAELAMPSGVAVDGAGNIYIADSANWRIRKVSPSGVITTVAGGGGSAFWFGGGAPGDGGPATSATLSNPQGVAVDAAGNLYIADSQDYAIRMVNVSGTINTVAGNGSPGSSGDGGPATSAQIGYVAGLTVDAGGNIYIGDHDNNRVRKITPNGIITTVAGNGSNGFSGDGGPATDAQFSGPQGVSVDRVGNLYLGDWGNQRIRKVTPSGTVTTVAGNGTPGFAGDGGPATNAELAGPVGVAVDASGNVYIADFGNNRIRKITFAAPNGQ